MSLSLTLALAALLCCPMLRAGEPPDRTPEPIAGQPQVLNLDRVMALAMERNHHRPASRFEVAMAEAQHRQALAAYWPQVQVDAGYQRLDQPLNFIFPASLMQIPAQSIAVPGATAVVTIPANAFGPGFPPSNVQMPVSYPNQTVNTPAQVFQVPEQNIKVLDQDFASGTLDLKWLLFDGGMRHGYREQSGGMVAMMQAEAHRTDLEIADSVRQMYWGAVLARQLNQTGKDTLSRMEVTLRLTESLFKEGSGKVTKADYLENTVMVESLRAMVAQLEKNEAMAQAALANTAGLAWNASIQPADTEIPFQPFAGSTDDMVARSYQFNPDWEKLEAALRAASGAVTTARSGYFPKIALTGELHRWWNNGYDAGFSTAQNRAGWTAGIGLEFPLFDGLLTRNKVEEAVARLGKLKENKFLLQEGLGLQVKDLVMGLDAAGKADRATSSAMQAASDDRDLNERAYQNELVETEKVVRAQLVEALMSAQHYKARYDYVALLSQLNVVVGTEVRGALLESSK